MPRVARPWYRRSRKTWYVQEQGKKYNLGVTDPNDEAGAKVAHEALITRLAAEVADRIQSPPVVAGVLVSEAAAAYLAVCERKVRLGKLNAKALGNYKRHLKHFAGAFGTRSLSSLTATEIEEWAADSTLHRSWSPTYQHGTLGTVGQMFKHAKIVIALSRPPAESRAGDVVLSDEQFDRVLVALSSTRGTYRGDLIPLLKTLRETGGRPGELAPLTTDRIDWENACTRRRDHKTRRYTGMDRVIHFNTAAMAVLESQRTKWGDGLLFRTRAGNAYRDTAIVTRLLKVSKRVGFRVIAYGLGRHSWATGALVNGFSDTLVAAALGHVDTKMVHRNYSHVNEQARAIKDVMERARPSKVAG